MVNVISLACFRHQSFATKHPKENIPLKYLKFWDVPDDKMDEAIQKGGDYLEKSEKTPEKYPRYIFPPHGMGKASGGVSIMEADNEEQLINYMVD